MWKNVVVAYILLFLTGCASVVTDKTQPIKVETITESGEKITNAKCELQNDRGAYEVETPKTVFVRKSAGNLIVTCNTSNYPQADATLISRTGGAVFGNIILGGVIGAVVDTASGIAYNYPEWVQLVFGKSLTFDRHDFKAAQPNPPKNEGEEIQSAASVESNNIQQPAPISNTAPVIQKVEYITIAAPDEPNTLEQTKD